MPSCLQHGCGNRRSHQDYLANANAFLNQNDDKPVSKDVHE